MEDQLMVVGTYTGAELLEMLEKIGWKKIEPTCIQSGEKVIDVFSYQYQLFNLKVSIAVPFNRNEINCFELAKTLMALCRAYEIKFFGKLESRELLPDEKYTYHQLIQDIIQSVPDEYKEMNIDEAIEILEDNGYVEPAEICLGMVRSESCRHTYIDSNDLEDFTIYKFATDEDLINFAKEIKKDHESENS